MAAMLTPGKFPAWTESLPVLIRGGVAITI
jgi:hypothetical protein